MTITDIEARRLVFCDPEFARDRIDMEALTGNRRAAVALVRERSDPGLWIAVRVDSINWPRPIRG